MNKVIAFAVSLCLLAILSSVFDSPKQNIDLQFQEWQAKYGVIVDQSVYLYRYQIFRENLEKVSKTNAQNLPYQFELNHFAHLTGTEFQQMFTSMGTPSSNIIKHIEVDDRMVAVTEIDWEKKGKVSPVQTQMNCDAGYSFCTSSLLESYLMIKKSQNLTLSQQQIIDCAEKYTTFGCSGGSRSGTVQYCQEIGLVSSESYPYKGVKGECQPLSETYKLPQKITQANGCDELAKNLQSSPLTVAVNTQNWQLYRTGILNNCGSEVNHDVFLVGVSEAFWRIKNSWGVRWGEFGYIRISSGNTCGVCSKPGYGFE